jgi:cyclophilin family peptidyl-prolyl cis-trans isomerase
VYLRICSAVLLCALAGLGAVPSAAGQDPPPNPRVLVETSMGSFEMELFRDRVPATVVNFLVYVRDGYYDGTVFHRVIRNLIVQGGGMVIGEDEQLQPKVEGLRGTIINQATRNLLNRRGTVAMARGSAPDSARQQFYINLDNNDSFNYRNGSPSGIGYAVFGQVTEGMDVVNQIGRVRTGNQDRMRDVPREPVIIHSITRVEAG